MSSNTAISIKQSQKRRLHEILLGFKKGRVLVIGDFILDQFVWGEVQRISPEAPVPVVNVRRESYMPGGTLNVASNIRTLGGTVYPCGVLGRDLQGRVLLKAIRREGIDTRGIIYDRERPTTVKTRIIAHSQQVVRFDREKVQEISKDHCQKLLRFIKQIISEVDVLIIEDYGKGVVQPPLLRPTIKLARQYRKPVLVDPKEKHFSYYAGVTALTPNRKEAYTAYENGRMSHTGQGSPSLQEVGHALVKRLKSEALLITLGEEGMALFERKGTMTHIPTTAREVYDVSGAGDTVIATFGLALAAGAQMKEAALISNLAAGIVVGKLGTATVSFEELAQAVDLLSL